MRRLLLVGLVVAMLGTACREAESPQPVRTSSEGRFPAKIEAANGTVTIPAKPAKIVSLSPTATEMLFAIGAGDRVIAADKFSNYPPGAPKTDLSGFQPNTEAVAKYKPDLVVFARDPGDFGSALKALEIPAILMPAAKTLTESYDQIKDLGIATGNIDKAEDLVAKMKLDIKKIVANAPKLEAGTTYYHELSDKFSSATSRTFVGQIYGLLRLKNIADEADAQGTGFPQLSAEYIVDEDPDFVLLADTKCCGQSYETVAARPGWQQLTAVKEHRVIALDDDVASRWGPRIVDFLRAVVAGLRASDGASD